MASPESRSERREEAVGAWWSLTPPAGSLSGLRPLKLLPEQHVKEQLSLFLRKVGKRTRARRSPWGAEPEAAAPVRAR